MHLLHVLHVPDLKCGGCLGFVVRALQEIDHEVRVEPNLAAHTISVISRRFESALLRTLQQAGYRAEPVLLPLG